MENASPSLLTSCASESAARRKSVKEPRMQQEVRATLYAFDALEFIFSQQGPLVKICSTVVTQTRHML
jgi:hypothetical protein